MHEAFDLGVTLFDAADTYGNGRSEELIAKAFGDRRDQIVIATKVGYDFVHHGDERRGQREIPQNFRPEAIRAATDAALKRLSTDHIDLLQLHNIRMDQVDDDDLWETLGGPAPGGKGEALWCRPWPGHWLAGRRREDDSKAQSRRVSSTSTTCSSSIRAKQSRMRRVSVAPETMFLIRVPHSSGMLEGKYTAETVFPPGRSSQPSSALVAAQWREEGRTTEIS